MDLFNKFVNLGLGAAFHSKDKIETWLNELEINNNLTKSQLYDLINFIKELGNKNKDDFIKFQDEALKKVKEKFPFVSQLEFEKLQQKVLELEKKLRENTKNNGNK